MKIRVAALIFVQVLLVGCSSTPAMYSGHFFDAEINGHKIVPIKDKQSKRSLDGYLRYDNVRWQIDTIAEGELDVDVASNIISKDGIGVVTEDSDNDVSIVPLEGQKKKTVAALSNSKDTYINGSSAISNRNYMADNLLPPGAYVIRVKVYGSDNWDRKEVYVQFK